MFCIVKFLIYVIVVPHHVLGVAHHPYLSTFSEGKAHIQEVHKKKVHKVSWPMF